MGGCLVGAVGQPGTSPWEWTFPCESIFKAGVHYQHNGPADGSSYHTRLSTLEAPSRWAALLGGRLRERRRAGQGSRGLHERLTASYQIFLDHNQHFPSVVKRDETEMSSYSWIMYLCVNCITKTVKTKFTSLHRLLLLFYPFTLIMLSYFVGPFKPKTLAKILRSLAINWQSFLQNKQWGLCVDALMANWTIKKKEKHSTFS